MLVRVLCHSRTELDGPLDQLRAPSQARQLRRQPQYPLVAHAGREAEVCYLFEWEAGGEESW
jgi:hypothetical protein